MLRHYPYMPAYYFRIRTPDQSDERFERRDLSSLSEAMAAANGTARRVIRRGKYLGPCDIRGNLDIEDEHQRPLARLNLSEVAQQIL